jgi:hypothetical protein
MGDIDTHLVPSVPGLNSILVQKDPQVYAVCTRKPFVPFNKKGRSAGAMTGEPDLFHPGDFQGNPENHGTSGTSGYIPSYQ